MSFKVARVHARCDDRDLKTTSQNAAVQRNAIDGVYCGNKEIQTHYIIVRKTSYPLALSAVSLHTN